MADVELGIGNMVTLRLDENMDIASSLVKHIFFRTFLSRYQNTIPTSFNPFRVFSQKEDADLIAQHVPADLRGALSRRKQMELQFRQFDSGGTPRLGATINFNYRWIFSRNCSNLHSEGFVIEGLQVLVMQPIPATEGVLAPDETLVGVVRDIQSGSAIVDTNDGRESYKLSELYLHKSTHNIKSYLEFRMGEKKAEEVIKRARKPDETRLNAKYYYNQARITAERFASLHYQNSDGFTFGISDSPVEAHPSFNIEQPTFLFDYNPGKSHSNPSAGLVNFGPYDSSKFTPKNIRVLVVCHKSNRGAFTEFLGKLKSGIAISSYFKNGMVGKYRLYDTSFDIIELEGYTVKDYAQAISGYIKSSEQLPHIAIVETRTGFKSLPPDLNPYYRTKSYLLSTGEGIPVQFVLAENIRREDVQWVCDGVALQLYAKLGGRPWVLPSSSSIDHEIVIGIGSSHYRANMFVGAEQERVVGITTFFTGDGRYIFGNRCKDVPFDEYFQELLQSLRSSIHDISSEYGWAPGDTIRIIFHIFKPMKDVEAMVVDSLLAEFPQYSIKFCFVKITTSHPFLLFDSSQSGVGYYKKGKFIPPSGTNWVMDDYSCLLQVSGPGDLKSEKHGFSGPILVSIHPKSTFRDLNFVVQQVHSFAYMSWRGFSRAQEPVTILYSKLIAKHLFNLRKVPGWKPELVNSLLRHKRWFL